MRIGSLRRLGAWRGVGLLTMSLRAKRRNEFRLLLL